jgi:hypothetical protein
MVDRRLLLQTELEKIIGVGDWIGIDVKNLDELPIFEIPETAKVGDFFYVLNDSTNNGQRTIRKIVEDPETHIKSSEYSTRPVYFQPPGNMTIEYPCAIYHLSDIYINRADNSVYRAIQRFTITLVDEDPDSKYVTRLLDTFGAIRFDRFFISDSLNHWVFSLYY